jgi:hypothetical protein
LKQMYKNRKLSSVSIFAGILLVVGSELWSCVRSIDNDCMISTTEPGSAILSR